MSVTITCPRCRARINLLDMDGSSKTTVKAGDSYWDRISEINRRQEEKGEAKYGQSLEENTTLTTRQRIEHCQEELIDGLKYLEHLKEVTRDGITANDYQRAALRTSPDEERPLRDHFLNGALGLAGESGEVADMIKKYAYQGHPLDTEKLIEELGDVAWYLALLAWAANADLGEVLQRNVDKLAKRYPEGFDKARSINREEK